MMELIENRAVSLLPCSRERALQTLAAPEHLPSWHPSVESACLFKQGCLLYRRSVLVGEGGELVERLWIEPNGDLHFQSVQGFGADVLLRSRLRLENREVGCEAVWERRVLSTFRGGEKERFDSFFRLGLSGLVDYLESN